MSVNAGAGVNRVVLIALGAMMLLAKGLLWMRTTGRTDRSQIASDRATLLVLAQHPTATVRLSPEQQEVAREIEQHAHRHTAL